MNVLKQPFDILSFLVCELFSYTQNWNWLQWIKLENFDFIEHFY